MADNSDTPRRSGFYTGGTWGVPTPVGGLGGGVYLKPRPHMTGVNFCGYIDPHPTGGR